MERGFYTTAHLEEISYAIQIGYFVEIKEALIHLHAKPIFREFFQLLAHMKLRHETATVAMSQKEKESYCSDLNTYMQFKGQLKLTTDILEPNFALRQFCKSVSNIILGTFQKLETKA